MSQFEQVRIIKKANVYFDGKCVSHTVILSDGSRKSVGVIFPASLTFSTDAPEIIEINDGICRARLKNEDNWRTYRAGESFSVPGNSQFDIEVEEMLDYVCHYG